MTDLFGSVKPHHVPVLFGEDDLHAGEGLAQLFRHDGHGGVLRVEMARVDEVDAGHFHTENPTMPILAEKLRKAFPGVEVVFSEKHQDVMKFY